MYTPSLSEVFGTRDQWHYLTDHEIRHLVGARHLTNLFTSRLEQACSKIPFSFFLMEGRERNMGTRLKVEFSAPAIRETIEVTVGQIDIAIRNKKNRGSTP